MAIAGHLWTVAPHLWARARPSPSEGEPWTAEFQAADGRRVGLYGMLHRPPDAKRLLLLLHGLGGSAESYYLWHAARAAHARGWATLRLGLRGAGDTGEDLYHAGLSEDLAAALAHPEFETFETLAVWGFSLGGHIALHLGLGDPPARLAGIATVCAPLDLARGARAIDAPRAWLYRRSVLSGLIENYAGFAERGDAPTSLERVQEIQTLREWDALTVVKRFGFASVDHYYAEQSAGPRLDALQCPALFVASRGDPMVPFHTVEPWLEAPPEPLTVRVTSRGGHVGFPPGLDLGLGSDRGIEAQVLHWLDDCARRR
jgi:predicted alpha/beta-fold hydrolase